jgi:bisanhydrobacterioruberin hydratase
MKQYYLRISSWLAPYSLWVIGVVHLVGLIGLLSPLQSYFMLVTPFNLVLSAFLLWINHPDSTRNLIRFGLVVFVLGYIVELIGVSTGLIFGHYTYGQTLGIKFLGVPIVIGLNWLLVMYCVATLTNTLKISVPYKIILASLLAVAIDWLIEPVAMQFDFWRWENNTVPWQNFVGWFIVSISMQSLYHVFQVKSENKLALLYYFVQLFFFLMLNIALS